MYPFKQLLNLFLKLFSTLPLSLVQFIGILFGSFLFIFPTRLKSTTISNLKLCFPKKNKGELNNLAKLSLIETSKTFFESGKCWKYYPSRGVEKILHIKGVRKLEKSIDKSKGVILFAPQSGAVQ